MVKFDNQKECIQQLANAMKSGSDAEIQQAWQGMCDSIAAKVRQDFEEIQESNDAAVLAQRGYRQLTTAERKWYQKLVDAGKSPNPKQAFITLTGSGNAENMMPITIIEDVYRHLREEHPLLAAINFQFTGYATKWILTDSAAKKAVWGAVTDAIITEITGGFKEIDMNQRKLSGFAILPLDLLDMGLTMLDGYVRTVLGEALMNGLEEGIINGNGVDGPVGLNRDISATASFNASTGYPKKTAVAVTSFLPQEYGPLVARMAKTENNMYRKIGKVGLICNPVDYLTKIMPATTVLTAAGTYANDVFPVPTDKFESIYMDEGEAILFLPMEFFCGMGGDKKGVIEFSDHAKFLEDQRAFKAKLFANGRAFDNTCAVLLDISGLEPAFITVLNKSAEVASSDDTEASGGST